MGGSGLGWAGRYKLQGNYQTKLFVYRTYPRTHTHTHNQPTQQTQSLTTVRTISKYKTRFSNLYTDDVTSRSYRDTMPNLIVAIMLTNPLEHTVPLSYGITESRNGLLCNGQNGVRYSAVTQRPASYQTALDCLTSPSSN